MSDNQNSTAPSARTGAEKLTFSPSADVIAIIDFEFRSLENSTLAILSNHLRK